MRILHAPRNIANQAWTVAQGLRANGHDVEVWHFGDNPYSFPCDRQVPLDQGPRPLVDAFSAAVHADFDVLHFHFARSLVPGRYRLPEYWDLPVWRALNKKIVFTFHGSDVRLRSHHERDDPWSFYRHEDIPCDEELIGRRLALVRLYADLQIVGSVLDLPYVDGAEYLPKSLDISEYPVRPPIIDRPPVVLHAPSRRQTKGTRFVVDGMQKLREEGLDFEFRLVEDVEHKELRNLYANADIVVEKLLGGDAGITSLEAMAVGRVAVARIRDEVRAAHPDLPVVSATPETFVSQMRPLLTDCALRTAISRQGRAYVEKDHASVSVARRLAELYSRASPRVDAPQFLPTTAHRQLERDVTRLERELEAYKRRLEATRARLEATRARLEAYKRRVEELQGARMSWRRSAGRLAASVPRAVRALRGERR